MSRSLISFFASLILLFLTTNCDNFNDMPNETNSVNQETVLQKTIVSDFVGFPYWARSEFFPRSIDGYSFIYFYVQDPNEIPADFNLFDFWDYSTFARNPNWAVDGFENYHNGDTTPIPKAAHLTGNGMVPVWFVPEEVAVEAYSTGHLTVSELEALNPIKGYADHFVEVLHPSNHPQYRLKTNASGYLENGGTFILNLSWNFDHANEDKVNGNIKLNLN